LLAKYGVHPNLAQLAFRERTGITEYVLYSVGTTLDHYLLNKRRGKKQQSCSLQCSCLVQKYYIAITSTQRNSDVLPDLVGVPALDLVGVPALS